MSLDPHNLLADVHPDLVKVITTASQSQPFEVISGIRTLATEEANVARGASQTLHSRHLPDNNFGGKACAVDIMCLDDTGHGSWDVLLYKAAAVNIKTAAANAHVPVEWGGDWHSLKDFTHWQLPWASYP